MNGPFILLVDTSLINKRMWDLGWTLCELSEKIGISERHLRSLMQSGKFPASILSAVCDALGLDFPGLKEMNGSPGENYIATFHTEKIKEDTSMANNLVQMHSDICSELTTLYSQKNHDYGDAFHKTFLEEGYGMSRIRLSDKLERFKALSKATMERQVADESLEDTLKDLANYAIMTIIEIRRANHGT